METKVVTYKNERLMQAGIKRERVMGWDVTGTMPLDQGRSAVKTIGLGLIFLPLALLGKRKTGFMVTFSRQPGNWAEEEPQPKSRSLRALGYIVLAIIVLIVIASMCS